MGLRLQFSVGFTQTRGEKKEGVGLVGREIISKQGIKEAELTD